MCKGMSGKERTYGSKAGGQKVNFIAWKMATTRTRFDTHYKKVDKSYYYKNNDA